MEKDLIKLAINGNVTAFEELIRQQERIAYNLAYRMLGNEQDAFDATQEAFLRAYLNISKFKGESAFSTWIYRIVHNACLDEIRKRKNAPITAGDEESAEIYVEASTPDDELSRKDTQLQIIDALSALAPQWREIVILRDVQGFSYNEIAEILQCSIGTVKSRVNRARIKLKSIMEQKLQVDIL